MAMDPDRPAGENEFPVTPDPLHVPPEVPDTKLLRFTGGDDVQMEGELKFQVASDEVEIGIKLVSETLQAPVPTV
jgi:hypothetical protein